MTTQVKPEPYIARYGSVVVKCDGSRIMTRDCHCCWDPGIRSGAIKINIANLVSTRSINAKCIRRTSFKYPSRWVIEPWHINLIHKLKLTTRYTKQTSSMINYKMFNFSQTYLKVKDVTEIAFEL